MSESNAKGSSMNMNDVMAHGLSQANEALKIERDMSKAVMDQIPKSESLTDLVRAHMSQCDQTPAVDVIDTGEEQFKLPIEDDTALYFNPLLDYPRNAPCICDSGKKFKKCHGPLIPTRISKADATTIIDSIKEFAARDET